jgi:hypothetical protein
VGEVLVPADTKGPSPTKRSALLNTSPPPKKQKKSAKKELNIIKLMTEKAARLDRDTFGVDGTQGPWQQRLAEIGGIKPLAFGQFGEMARPRGARPRQRGEAGGGRDGGSISPWW